MYMKRINHLCKHLWDMERQIIAFLKMNYTTGINEILDDTQTEERKIAKQDILNRSLSYPELFYQFFPEIN